MKTYKPFLVTLAVLAAAAAWIATQPVSADNPPDAQSCYSIIDLGTLPGHPFSFVWGGVNKQGHVAVYTSNDPNSFAGATSFLWKGPKDIELLPGLPGSDTAVPFGLNDLDQVVGGSGPTPDGYLAVLWENGQVKALPKLPGDTDADAYLINNAGLIVGHSANFNVDPWTDRAVYWYEGGVFALPSLAGAVNSSAVAVNDRNQIVGQSGPHAAFWSLSPKPRVVDLGTLGGDDSWAAAINTLGQIVGNAATESGDLHPVLWNKHGIIDLHNFGDDTVGSAFYINDEGQIVGFSGTDPSDVTKMRALLWENGRIINLQDQLPANSGWVLQQATGINNQGQITGIGMHKGKNRVFLLTPTNAPGQ
jgi:probable HAF family extracellular repeat protein